MIKKKRIGAKHLEATHTTKATCSYCGYIKRSFSTGARQCDRIPESCQAGYRYSIFWQGLNCASFWGKHQVQKLLLFSGSYTRTNCPAGCTYSNYTLDKLYFLCIYLMCISVDNIRTTLNYLKWILRHKSCKTHKHSGNWVQRPASSCDLSIVYWILMTASFLFFNCA